MRRIFIAASLLAAIAIKAPGQHMAALGDSTLVGDKLYERLFHDMALDTAAAAKAHRLIVRTFVDQTQFGFVVLQSTWLKVVALQEARDSALVALLPDRTWRGEFAVRARATRPRHHFWQWPEP
jgi:hypothetical protein